MTETDKDIEELALDNKRNFRTFFCKIKISVKFTCSRVFIVHMRNLMIHNTFT